VVVAGVMILDENVAGVDALMHQWLWSIMKVQQGGQALVQDGQALVV